MTKCKPWRRWATLGAAIAVTFTGAVSSVAPPALAGSPMTLDVVSNFTADVARGVALDQLIKQFNSVHKGAIKVVSQTTADWPSLQAKIRTQIAVGTPPDVFLYNYNPSDLSLERYGAKKLINWTPYLNRDPSWKASFPPDALRTVEFGGDTVAVPDDQASTVVYYRKDLFRKAGIATFPATWAQFFADAKKLEKAGITPVALFTADDAWYAMNFLSALAVSDGGTGAYHATHFETAPLVQAATSLKELFGYAPKDAVGGNYAIGSADFLDGRAAMVIDGPWLISSIEKDIPNSCGTVGVAAPPTGGDGIEAPGTLITDALTVWGAAKISDRAEQAAAVAWMKFYTSASSAVTMATTGQFPLIVKTPLSGPAVAHANCVLRDELAFSDRAPARVVNIERYMSPEAQAQLPNLLEELVLGGTTPAKFVSTLQKLNS
jgi:ABC-type glycerol-3-phosphate transport system substrate-binding protein